MPQIKHKLYGKGDILPNAFHLQDGIVCLWDANPYTRKPLIIDWIKPGEYYGEEFSVGLSAFCNAWAVRAHTWSIDVEVPLDIAVKSLIRRLENMRDILLLKNIRYEKAIRFLYYLLKLPFPSITIRELLETAGASSYSSIGSHYRKMGFFNTEGRRITFVDTGRIMAEIKRTLQVEKDSRAFMRKLADKARNTRKPTSITTEYHPLPSLYKAFTAAAEENLEAIERDLST